MLPPQRSVQLAPNEQVSFDDPRIKYPVMASYKLDGMRAIVYDGVLYSRNLKPLTNSLQAYFADLCKLAQEAQIVLDGELFYKTDNFGAVMSTLTKEGADIPEQLQFHAFDCVKIQDWGVRSDRFELRFAQYFDFCRQSELRNVAIVHQEMFPAKGLSLEGMFTNAIAYGYEGIVLKSMSGLYKHGRATLNEGSMFKFKNWVTEDAMIYGFEQATAMKKEYQLSDRGTDELGRTARSSKKDTRELVNGIGSINVRLPSGVIAGCGLAKGVDIGLTWENKESFIGKMVEIHFISHGVKDKPRFASILRLRPDLDA